MYPLIEITTVPIEMEIKTTRAKFEVAHGTAEMEISRNDGGVQIKGRPIRLNLDTLQIGNSALPRMQSQTRAAEVAKTDNTTVYNATASFVEQGRLLVNAYLSQTAGSAGSMINEAAPQTSQFSNDMMQSDDWDQSELSIRYDMDKLNFDWNLGKKNLTFVPGDVEISVKQRADLIIKYVGGIIYVPPSADPDYVPMDAEA